MIEHTIYKEFIDKIAELSDGIYPIITDLDNDLSYVPEKTADFFGLEPASIPVYLNSFAHVSTTLTCRNIGGRSAIV